MLTNLRVVIIFSILAATYGCGRLSGGNEVVYAPTEVGSPAGDRVTKDIGPAGGTFASSDGRLTLTVPQNAIAETVTFAIQPITNMATNGLGNAYRLEPDGKTFTIPLEVSIRYDDNDLEGTVPEALSFAYQDKQGAWHAQESAKVDQAAKTISFAASHFTDMAAMVRLRLSPVEARVRVGHSQPISLVQCPEPGFFDRILSRPLICSASSPAATYDWELQGAGTLQSTGSPSVIYYQAPARKPADNIALVRVKTRFGIRSLQTGEITTVEKTFAAKMIIVDRGYKATGTWSGMSFSGLVCSLDKPFTILGQTQLTFNFKFTPSSLSGTDGTVAIGGGGMGVTISDGSGTYTVTGADTDSPTITLTATTFTGSYPGVGSAKGGGMKYIHLVPLDGNECDGN